MNFSDRTIPTPTDKNTAKETSYLSAVVPPEITDDSCKTYIFKGEGHTLGNPLRYVISHYSEVTFCGYTIPHPSENVMHLRIQTDGTPTIDILKRGLQDLESICKHTMDTFENSMDEYKAETQTTNST